jgi:LmbE family N-acetylglucosaminyl deacetylase
MGGTIRKLIEQDNKVSVLFLSDGVTSRENLREEIELRRSSSINALKSIGCSDLEFCDYPDNKLDSIPLLNLCKTVENHIRSRNTEIVFTHFPFDLNIDHRRTQEATLVACRPNSDSLVSELYFFETVSSTDWKFGDRRFSPNLFVDITNQFPKKLLALQHYEAEINDFPNARSMLSIESLANFRGASIGFRKAEAFELGLHRIK